MSAGETAGNGAVWIGAARAFYVRQGLQPSPTDDLHLMALVKDIRAASGSPVGRR